MAINIKVDVVGGSTACRPSRDTPLLYVLRDRRYNAAKFGCGVAQCGACRVTMAGQCAPARRRSTRSADRNHHARGPRHNRAAASAAGGVHGGAGGPVRLLRSRIVVFRRRRCSTAIRGRARRMCAGAGRKSVPLRHPQPHCPRGLEGGASGGFDRRDLAARLRCRARQHALAFTLAPRPGFAQQPARLPGGLDGNRLLDAPGFASAPTAMPLSVPARSSSARAS